MRLIAFPSLAAISLALAVSARAATRPHYGGTLRIETRAALATLDPAAWPTDPAQAALEEKLLALTCDTLVRLDAQGQPQPALAAEWQPSADHKIWRFRLRAGLHMSDGSPLTAAAVVAALAAENPGWRLKELSLDGYDLEIASDQPIPNLPADLAAAGNSIFRRDEHGNLVGTGPFRITEWEPGRRAVLAANEDYWGGRPFLEGVDLAMGRAPRDQLIDFELGKADLIEVLPDQARRATQSGGRVWSSAPVELFALVFQSGRPVADDGNSREALALSIDRAALAGVLLQKQAEPAGALLPQWLSGYAFLFSAAAAPDRARQLGASVTPAASVSLGYDATDPLARSVAERVAVNARAAGIAVQVAPQAPGAAVDARLVRLRVSSAEPRRALMALAAAVGMSRLVSLPDPATPEQLYVAERALLAGDWVVPVVALPETYGLGLRVRDWMPPRAAIEGWRLEDVWVEEKAP